MKHFYFLLPILIFSLLCEGCGEHLYTITIINNSSETVSYSYNGSSDMLAASTPASARTYQVKAYTPPPTNVSPPARVKTVQGSETFTFENLIHFDLTVTNTAATTVTIEAGKYIKNGGSTQIELTSGETKNSGITIYTDSPSFTIVSPTPSNLYVQWSISGNTMTATIR